MTYEAYGAGGTGFIMECLTDNVNRCADGFPSRLLPQANQPCAIAIGDSGTATCQGTAGTFQAVPGQFHEQLCAS